jgi:tRNA threonylcarbamoyladenosine biosynthesis protein TsaB
MEPAGPAGRARAAPSLLRRYVPRLNQIDRADLSTHHDAMLILALEQSTSSGSAALLQDTVLLAERSWDETNLRNQHVFATLTELFREAAVEPQTVELFAVGLGPGAFSGVRIALSAIRGLALPGQKPVTGVSSAEALAVDIGQETKLSSITVAGDARRERFWIATYDVSETRAALKTPLKLVPAGELAAALSDSAAVATPDWERIGNRLREAAPPGATVIQTRRVPRAQTIGLLAIRKQEEGEPPLPLTPIYLHPGVFVAPSFPA